MQMNDSVQALIARFDLHPHPEGGFFRETYRSSEGLPVASLPARYGSDRSFCTGIYYLLPEGTTSRLHRLKSDEMWHFYLGGPLGLVQLFPDGTLERVVLGQDIAMGQSVQHVVPAGVWFGARPGAGSGFSFVGCTVAPGFDFADFEIGKRDGLIRSYPGAQDVIEQFTDECVRSAASS